MHVLITCMAGAKKCVFNFSSSHDCAMATAAASSSKVPAGAVTDVAGVGAPVPADGVGEALAASSSPLSSSMLASNPYFSAGFGLMVFGTALAVGRRGITVLATQTQRRLLVSLEIPSKDKAHPWFLQWMGAQAKAQAMRNAGLLPARKETLREFIGLSRGGQEAEPTEESQHGWDKDPLQSGSVRASPIRIFSHELAVETSAPDIRNRQQQQQDSSTPRGDARFSLIPGPGTHWFRYKGCWMRVSGLSTVDGTQTLTTQPAADEGAQRAHGGPDDGSALGNGYTHHSSIT